MAEYTVTTNAEEEKGLDILLPATNFGSKADLVSHLVKSRAINRLREEHERLIVKNKTPQQLKTELDAL